jgi:hypothetical protein
VNEQILDHVWNASGIRMMGDGVPGGDVAVARDRLRRWEEWYPFWAGRGDEYERLRMRRWQKGAA